MIILQEESGMPIYEYRCDDCGKISEFLVIKSDEVFAKAIAALCAQPKYAERPAASAAVDLLMNIKP